MRGLRNDKYTFVIERDGDGRVINYRLFDNISDPYQLQNISDANPSLVKKFERELFNKIKTINDPLAVCLPKY